MRASSFCLPCIVGWRGVSSPGTVPCCLQFFVFVFVCVCVCVCVCVPFAPRNWNKREDGSHEPATDAATCDSPVSNSNSQTSSPSTPGKYIKVKTSKSPSRRHPVPNSGQRRMSNKKSLAGPSFSRVNALKEQPRVGTPGHRQASPYTRESRKPTTNTDPNKHRTPSRGVPTPLKPRGTPKRTPNDVLREQQGSPHRKVTRAWSPIRKERPQQYGQSPGRPLVSASPTPATKTPQRRDPSAEPVGPLIRVELRRTKSRSRSGCCAPVAETYSPEGLEDLLASIYRTGSRRGTGSSTASSQ